VGDSHLFQNPPPEISDHPLFRGGQTVGLMTAEAPRFPSAPGGNAALKQDLQRMGLKHELTHGSYGGPENSFIVYGATREQLYGLGRKYGQEAVVHSQDGKHELTYTHGPKAGKFHPSLPTMGYSAEQPPDYYTKLPGRGHITLHFDFNKLHDSPVQHTMPLEQQTQVAAPVTKAEIALRLAAVLRKSISPQPWAGAYPWHDGHSSYHRRTIGHGVLLDDKEAQNAAALSKGDKQLHPVDGGVSTYAQHAVPFGRLTPGEPTQLKHYPLEGKGQAIDQLLAQHGFQARYAGGPHGRPQHSDFNYDTGHLTIMDSGGDDHADGWRKLHELAHALTLPAVNAIYGEGRRAGALGKARTTREAMRAVHWEHLAAHKQRELAAAAGAPISDEAFHREHNTVMHDAVHRAITGEVTDPSGEGFSPHSHAVPLETSLGMVREAGARLGLQNHNDVLRKAAQDIGRIIREALERHGA